MVDQVPNINGERLLRNLRELRIFGACGPGVIRRSLTPVDVSSRPFIGTLLTRATDYRTNRACRLVFASLMPRRCSG